MSAELYDVIDSFIKNSGYPPNLAEMAEAIGVSSTQAKRYLDLLERNGNITIQRRAKNVATSTIQLLVRPDGRIRHDF